MRKCGNEEMNKIHRDYRVLDMCYHLVQFTYLLVGCHSDDQFHSIVQSMARSRARLGTNSFGRVKGPKARSLD